MERFINKLREINEELNDPDRNYDSTKLKFVIERIKKIVEKRFGVENEYFIRLNELYNSDYFFGDVRSKLSSLIDLIMDEIELDIQKEILVIKPNESNDFNNRINKVVTEENNKVFVVHGHNNEIKQTVARVVEKLGLEPVILHEQPNMGMTIIEKFLYNSNVGFAVVLLSGDDLVNNSKTNKQSFRARQNVVLELGFFYAKLGRNRVVALVESEKDIELPSDIHGIIYIPYDGDSGKWKFELAKELSNNGYVINANDIL